MAGKLECLLRWLNATDTPRWGIAVGGMFMTLLTLGGTYIVEDRVSSQEARAEEIDVLRASMVDFQVFASAFATEMLNEKKVSNSTRSRLIENLNQQFALVRQMDEGISQEALPEIENYKKTLLKMVESANKSTDIISMSTFWSAASDLTVSKNRLNKRLQQIS